MTSVAAARRVWAVVPAAGRGERFETASSAAAAAQKLPKQYAELLGSSVLEWSLRALLHEARIEGIFVALSSVDTYGVELIASLNEGRLHTTTGGATRQESVMNGLKALEGLTSPDDWILVHDAARPCLSFADVRALIDALDDTERAGGCGVVLAAPIFDTIKRERDGLVSETVDRTGLWRALTPQVFGFSQLRNALSEAMRSGLAVTDEAQAMERFGHRPRLVQGSPLNIKVTRPEDLTLAAEILKNAGKRDAR